MGKIEANFFISLDGVVESPEQWHFDYFNGDIGMSGSATLVRWLLANGLLDELHLMLHPIAVGHGKRLFEDTPTYPLELVSHETFKTGVLNLSYAPASG